MTDLMISPDEETLEALLERAQAEQTTPEALAARLLKESLVTPSWAAVGLFSSGKPDTAQNADAILKSEWNPD